MGLPINKISVAVNNNDILEFRIPGHPRGHLQMSKVGMENILYKINKDSIDSDFQYLYIYIGSFTFCRHYSSIQRGGSDPGKLIRTKTVLNIRGKN